MIVEKIEIDKKPVLEKKMDIDTFKKGGEKAEKKEVVKMRKNLIWIIVLWI